MRTRKKFTYISVILYEPFFRESLGIFNKNRMSLSRSFSELFVTQLSLDELLDEEKNPRACKA